MASAFVTPSNDTSSSEKVEFPQYKTPTKLYAEIYCQLTETRLAVPLLRVDLEFFDIFLWD